MPHPRAVMNEACTLYRNGMASLRPVMVRPLDRRTFAQCLENAWYALKKRTERQAREAEAIAWTSYLPAHMSQERAIREIHARYGVPF